MDAPLKARLDDVRAALAHNLGAAQAEAITLLDEIEVSLERGDAARATRDEAMLRMELGYIGQALVLFSRHTILNADRSACAVPVTDLGFVERGVKAAEEFAATLRERAASDPEVWGCALGVANAIDALVDVMVDELVFIVPALEARTARHLRS